MAGFVAVGALAAFGLLCAVWTALGWILPRGGGMAVVWMGSPDAAALGRMRWLRNMGLLCCPLLAVDALPENTPEDVETVRASALLARLEWERDQVYGTGNGDPPGRHQRRGISEL